MQINWCPKYVWLDLILKSLLGLERCGIQVEFNREIKDYGLFDSVWVKVTVWLDLGLFSQASSGSRRFKVNYSVCFLWTITLYHSTLSPMPTDRPVPVSINQSPPTIFFSLPVALKSSEFHLLLCFACFFLSPFHPCLFFLSSHFSSPPSTFSVIGQLYWPLAILLARKTL